jgi:hypothetical protein
MRNPPLRTKRPKNGKVSREPTSLLNDEKTNRGQDADANPRRRSKKSR